MERTGPRPRACARPDTDPARRGCLAGRPSVTIDTPIRNVNRTVGTLLGHEVTKAYGGEGLPDDTIVVNLTGSAGNSLGAFVPAGITLRLEGDANDYVGKGLSGGRIIVRPPREAPFVAEENVIAGNVIGYGATGGEMFLRGVVGERFCVRNSGATVVAEGRRPRLRVHDRRPSGGAGPTGRNFAAGMSGGIAFVYDPDGMLPQRTNHEMVALGRLTTTTSRGCVSAPAARPRTDSAVASRLLADWDAAAASFVKVMPTDFKRVLEAAAAARAEGRDETEAVMAAARA